MYVSFAPTRRDLTTVRRLRTDLARIERQTRTAWKLRHIIGDQRLVTLSYEADRIENELDLMSNAAGAY